MQHVEMISFWLLCWKLLRATTGLRRAAGELTDGNPDDSNSGAPPPVPVAMEISSSPPLLMDLDQNYRDEEEGLHYPEVQQAPRPISSEHEDNCDYLLFEIGKKNEEEAVDDFWTTETMATKEEVKQEVAETDSQSERLFLSGAEGVTDSEERVQLELPDRTGSQLPWALEAGLRDDLSDCLQAELAMVYSDSDQGDDQWASSLNSNVISQTGRDTERRNETLTDEACAEEQEEKEELEKEEEHEEDEEPSVKPGRERSDSREEMACRRDMFLRGSSSSSTTSSTDPDKKLPPDCVSSEHMDFLQARQQWKKMEEDVRPLPPNPELKTPSSCQGTHSSLYPPTRSPRLKHREVPREAPLSSTLSPGSEDSGLGESYRSPLEPESAVEREIRLTLERDEKHRRERGLIDKGITVPRPSCLQTSRSPPRPPACRTPTLSVSPSFSPSPSPSSVPVPRSYHELTASNVIILEPDTSPGARSRLLSSAALSDWSGSGANVVVVETSNLIIRSASEFCLNTAPAGPETQESTFSSNPFFKLRSLSSQSLVEQEIRVVRQREDEWRRQRDHVFRDHVYRDHGYRGRRDMYHTVLVSPGLTDTITVPEVADRCVSSPSSPSRTRRMDRSSLSCDHKFPSSLSAVPKRQNAMAQRWEASLLANQKTD